MSSKEFTDETFDVLFNSFTRYAFRLEALPSYNVETEHDFLSSFLAGQPLPPKDFNKEWRDNVFAKTKQGSSFERVRVLTDPLTPYLCFEIEWGYLPLAEAGEQIYMIQPDDFARLSGIPDFDYWLFDDTTGVRMVYSDGGTYKGFEKVPDPELTTLVQARSQLLGVATPLKDWLSEIRSSI